MPFDKLPKGEHDHAECIERLLSDIGYRIFDFQAAVALFDDCFAFMAKKTNRTERHDEYVMRSRWLGMAAREAAATIYRFREDVEIIARNLNQCPTLAKRVDHDSKKEAMRVFNQYFPGFDGIRHGSQHYARLYGSPEDISRHAVPGPVIVVNSIAGHTIQTAFKKKTVTLDLTEESFLKLREVRDLYWQAWIPAQ